QSGVNRDRRAADGARRPYEVPRSGNQRVCTYAQGRQPDRRRWPGHRRSRHHRGIRRAADHRYGAAMTDPTRWMLADGRELLMFALPGHTLAPVPDRRPLPERGDQQSQLRFDRQTGQWVIIAALRQDRTYKPPPDQCPLCPGPSGLTSEIPAPDYDVAVFENRFPSLSGAGDAPFDLPFGPDTSAGDLLRSAPGHGRCEVICFSSDHTGSFSQLAVPHARLVVDAWRHRTADLMARRGIANVF